MAKPSLELMSSQHSYFLLHAQKFLIGSTYSVDAKGTNGSVFRARYSHDTSEMLQILKGRTLKQLHKGTLALAWMCLD